MVRVGSAMSDPSLAPRPTPLTDACIRAIAARLRWRGARSAAARFAGISRQNLGKFFREKGIGRDSEVLLRLDKFSRLPRPEQLLYCARPGKGAGRSAERTTDESPEVSTVASSAASEELPHWML
jgi:hypothetical protein